jgi:hypothetical protein
VIARVARRARYVALLALRTRAPLAPLTATILAAIGVYAYPRSGVGETWGLTALMACALSAWLVGAVLAAEPVPQADIATVALGGRRGRARLDATLVVLVAAGQTAWLVSYPLVARRLGYTDVFVPPPHAVDVFVAALAHLCCALPGGSLAVRFAPPRLAPASQRSGRGDGHAAGNRRRLQAARRPRRSRSRGRGANRRPPAHDHHTRADRLRELPPPSHRADHRWHALGERPRLSDHHGESWLVIGLACTSARQSQGSTPAHRSLRSSHTTESQTRKARPCRGLRPAGRAQ